MPCAALAHINQVTFAFFGLQQTLLALQKGKSQTGQNAGRNVLIYIKCSGWATNQIAAFPSPYYIVDNAVQGAASTENSFPIQISEDQDTMRDVGQTQDIYGIVRYKPLLENNAVATCH